VVIGNVQINSGVMWHFVLFLLSAHIHWTCASTMAQQWRDQPSWDQRRALGALETRWWRRWLPCGTVRQSVEGQIDLDDYRPYVAASRCWWHSWSDQSLASLWSWITSQPLHLNARDPWTCNFVVGSYNTIEYYCNVCMLTAANAPNFVVHQILHYTGT